MRILLADHHPHALWALRTSLGEKPEFKIIGEATDADTLIAKVNSQSPDLVLVDWEFPGRPIEDLIATLHSLEVRPVIVVMSTKPEHGRMFLQIGADAFISKGDQFDWLLEVLQKYEKQSRKDHLEKES